MNLSESIKSAEEKYKQILESFFKGVFNEKSLPSHGLDHHRRVWNYAKEILALSVNVYPDIYQDLPDKLIIACYLHDIGMSVETGIKHGIYSSDLCKTFLNKNNLNIRNYEDVILAIENHDAKEYSVSIKTNEVLEILSIADDLDAFGYIGIFRYAEIYLERNVHPEKFGHLIISNAANRFENFRNRVRSNDAYFRKHEERFNILNNFFTGYNNQLLDYQYNNNLQTGYCGIIKMISKGLITLDSPRDIFKNNKNTINDPVIKWYIKGLEGEKG